MNASAIENYIPLPQAAKRLKITAIALKRLIDNGKIHAVRLGGTLAVAESELKQTIFRAQFEHLRGQAITVPQAVNMYGINAVTIRNWIRHQYIAILKDGYGTEIDQADMAYCAAVYQSLGGVQGKRLFDEDGSPYQLRKPESAEYKREWRKKKKQTS
ncbi:MAG: hypothetical protein KA765_01985 [Thermoflexales bacterium]|nr:hypothetical protein [Thermoflexales bacterium]